MHLLKYFDKLSLKPENSKELKGLILDLAIRGRLSEEWRKENPDVEPAFSLLEKIKGVKAKLIKEKKIRKEKPLSEIGKDGVPFELPMGWAWCRFGNIISFLNGYAFKSSTYVDQSSFQVIRLGNVKNDYFKINAKQAFVPDSIGKANLDYKLYKGDVLTTLTGTKGKRDYCFTCIVTSEHLKDKVLLLNQRVGCIRSIEKSSFELFNYFLKAKFILDQLFASESGTANQGNIGSTTFKNLIFPLPPLEEQKAVVKIVNQLMAEVDQLEAQTTSRVQLRQDFIQSSLRQLTTANSAEEWKKLQPHFTSIFDTTESIDKLKEAILQLAVQGKLTKQWRAENPDVEPASVLLERIKEEKARLIKDKKIRKEKPLPEISVDEIPFELPEGWVITNFGELITLKSGQDLKPTQYSNTDQSGLPYITGASNLKNDKVIINRWTNEPKSIAFKGDLLLTCKGSGVGKMGWLHVEKAHIARQIMAINTLGSSIQFVRIFLNTKLIFFKENANGLIPGLDRKMIRTLVTFFPPLAEQKEIVRIVNNLFDACDRMKIEVENRNTFYKDFLESSIREVMEQTESTS